MSDLAPVVDPDRSTTEGWIELTDGTRLHMTLWLPRSLEDPVACLLEALPYRKDDLTAGYGETYQRLVDEGRFGVCRVDLRGTGSSSGIAVDEYPDSEIDDLSQVVRWLSHQPWCTGRVGAFGTSYSGFNSLHLAAAGIPELGAICAVYSSDDRYTDDVHYTGGALRALDLVDYVTYMVAMNGLPPVPAIWGPGWEAEWRRRLDETPPWVAGWLRAQTDGPEWRRGSIRLGPDGAGYERIGCPTMLVAGWADGYRNNTFRTVARLQVPWRLLIGPWGHQSPDTARPGPNVELVPELIGWFDEHLRGGPTRRDQPIQVFVREWSAPDPDRAQIAGHWRSEPGWPPEQAGELELALGTGTEEHRIRPDVGVAGWISCAGGLPWGQPLDQRADDAWSVTTDWPVDDPVELLGHPRLRLRVRADAVVAYVSAKLSAVAPDGTSALVTRGLLNLCHRNCWPVTSGGTSPAPEPVEPEAWYDVVIDLDATSWRFDPGHRIRLALTGVDWPNIWPPPSTVTLGFDRSRSSLVLPVLPAVRGDVQGASPSFRPGPGPAPPDDNVVWRLEHDVLGRETRAVTHYGGPFVGTHGAEGSESYDGVVATSTVEPGRAWAEGRAELRVRWPEADCRTESLVRVRSDPDLYHLDVRLVARRGDCTIRHRRWSAEVPRHLQ